MIRLMFRCSNILLAMLLIAGLFSLLSIEAIDSHSSLHLSELQHYQIENHVTLVTVDKEGLFAVSLQIRQLKNTYTFPNKLSAIGLPSISPNGRLIAYEFFDSHVTPSNHYLRILNIQQSHETAYRYITSEQFSWAADSKRLLLISAGTPLKVLDLETKALTTVKGSIIAVSASLSPDATSVVFEQSGILKKVDLPTGDTITVGMGSKPTWSPDGKWIAFIDNDKYIVSSPNGTNRKIISSASKRHTAAHWSPDSQYVCYTKMIEGSEKIPRLPEYDDNYIVKVTRIDDTDTEWVYRHGGFFPWDFLWVHEE